MSATWLLQDILFHKIIYAFLISPFVPIALLNPPPPPHTHTLFALYNNIWRTDSHAVYGGNVILCPQPNGRELFRFCVAYFERV
jgi:hypothetical protein